MYPFPEEMQNRLNHQSLSKICLLSTLLFLCLPAAGFAMDVTLGWDANTEPDRAGYRIYYDTASGPPYEGAGATEGSSPIDVIITDVESGDSAEYTVTGLNDSETYFLVITAYNSSDRESDYSTEVSTADDISMSSEATGKGGGGCFIMTVGYR